MKTFSIKEALTYGWEKMKSEFGFVFQAGVIMWGIVLLSEGVYRFIDVEIVSKSVHDIVLVFVALVTIAISVVMQVGFYKIYLKLYDDEEATLKDLFSHYKLSIKLLTASILQGLVIFVGFLLLIIPGIIFALMFSFTKLIVVDTGVGPIDALKQSMTITKGARLQLFKLALVLFFLNIFGILLIVGFFITVPISLFSLVYVYRKLSLQTLNVKA